MSAISRQLFIDDEIQSRHKYGNSTYDMAITMALSINNADRYFILPEMVPTLKAEDETFISVSSMGITTGKLRMAMSAKLLLVREAIADIMVSADAKPKLPSNKAEINKG